MEELINSFLLWLRQKTCDHIWKVKKQEKLGYSNIITKFPVAGHPGKKFVTIRDVFAETQKCVRCGKEQLVKNEYQTSSGLVDANK